MLKLAPIFSHHMVLQRKKRILIWGECDAEQVQLSINGVCAKAETRENQFRAYLPPMEAGGPYTLTVSCGEEKQQLEDVMIGEVWLAGGQSNMELELQNSFEGDRELAQIEKEAVRYYYVPKKPWVSEELLEEEAKSSWMCADRETSGVWSAVAYYFAKEISRKLNITVGIIGCNWGGTSASCWIGREKMEQNQKIASYVREYDEIIANQDFEEYCKEREEYIIYQTEFEKNVSHYYETCPEPTWDEAIRLFGENKYPGPMGPYSEFRPSGLYESMLTRVCPYSLAGFLYYQGEEDDHKPETYYELLSALIEQWREDWEEDTLPFLLVQLPVFRNVGEPDFKNWPLIREAQMRVSQTVRNTGIAVILENGEDGNIHPTKKEIVGKRLALQAFYHVYHLLDRQEAYGPVYRDFYVEDCRMVLRFENCADGFACHGEVTGFEIAGADKVYHAAEYRIEGSEIILWSEHVAVPEYARYCWTNFQNISLFGKNGIPVAPFRTSRKDGSRASGSRLSNEGVM